MYINGRDDRRKAEVLPFIRGLEMAGQSDREMIMAPASCPTCGGNVGKKAKVGGDEGAILFCLNPDCTAKPTGKIKKWVADTGMMDIGAAIIDAMVDSGLVSDPADLYLLISHELAEMKFGKGVFGTKRANKTVARISDKKTLPLNTFIGALGIEGLGEGIARNIREKAPGQFDTIQDWLEPNKLIPVKDQVSLPNVAEGIANRLRSRSVLIKKLLAVGVQIQNETPQNASGAANPNAFVICLTGAMSQPRNEIEDMILAAGHKLADGVNSKTTHLCQADPTSQSSKSKKANELKIPIISEEQLMMMIEQRAPTNKEVFR
jgi:DNA ligase (NAD+)